MPVREHVARSWSLSRGQELSESDFRRLAKVLSVRTMYLTDGGHHELAAQVLLNDLTEDPEQARDVWQKLEREGQRLAEERSFTDRKGLVRRLELQGINLRPVARLRADIRRLRDLTPSNVQALAAALTIWWYCSVPASIASLISSWISPNSWRAVLSLTVAPSRCYSSSG